VVEGLTINSFDGNGISIFGSNNTIQGNFIGTDASGTQDWGNLFSGVGIGAGATDNVIGGTEAGARNIISGSNEYGVKIEGFGATLNKVQGNYIGTTADGNAELGNFCEGVFINGASNNTIGGLASGAGNVISGNNCNGTRISFVGATDNNVQGNYIGTDKNGTADLGNSHYGVFISRERNTLGSNTIAFNGKDNTSADGVRVNSGTGNSMLRNLIFSNADLGIDLGAEDVTLNDDDDPDAGPNNLQNFPVITSAIRNSTTGDTSITGTLNSNPSPLTYIIECFVTDSATRFVHGEGAELAGSTTTTTNADGDATFTCTSNVPELGDTVSTTATNTTTGDTSEFSENHTVSSGV
jgi:hypothetical protein